MHRRTPSIGAALALGVWLSGCGGSAPAPIANRVPTTFGPHGGPALALPGEKGYAEIVSEALKGSNEPIVAVYFLNPDRTTALTPMPTDARIKTSAGEMPLTPAPGPAKDPAGSARVVSGPLPIDPDRVAGELLVTIDGQPFASAFALGQ